MNNLQRSEIVISRILNLLMDWGIQEANLEFSELELDPGEFGSFFFPCVKWLQSEGIIRTGNIIGTKDSVSSGVVVNPSLTSFGLDVLGREIALGPENVTLASQIKHVSESGPNYSSAGDFLGGLLGGFTKSLGS